MNLAHVYFRQPSTPLSNVEITLFQYRPAWFEQLVLRMAGIAFVVQNSTYGATESTGPLPFLRDLRPEYPPVLVGRKQTSVDRSTVGSSIVDYLVRSRQIQPDLMGGSADKDEKERFHLYANLLTTSLQSALLILCYDDDDAWRQVYRRQCVHASSAKQQWVSGLWYTAWSDHVVTQHQLGPTRLTLPQALTEARRCYELFDARLSENQYLLGGSQPTVVDALLFDHLANAFCNVHLVTVLPDFGSLAKFFDSLYNKYFASGHEEWMVWNRAQNQTNSFLHFPPLERIHRSKFEDTLIHIHEVVQAMSTSPCDVTSVLRGGQQRRAQPDSVSTTASRDAVDVKWQALSPTETPWRNGVIMVIVGAVALSLLRSKRVH